jgi:hypothetical protein
MDLLGAIRSVVHVQSQDLKRARRGPVFLTLAESLELPVDLRVLTSEC